MREFERLEVEKPLTTIHHRLHVRGQFFVGGGIVENFRIMQSFYREGLLDNRGPWRCARGQGMVDDVACVAECRLRLDGHFFVIVMPDLTELFV